MATNPLEISLKQAMRALAKAVSLISCRALDGTRFVMPATAITPVSMNPPSMLMCVNRDASAHPALASGVDFSISILRADQVEIARRCTGSDGRAKRFDKGDWRDDPDGTPYLADALATVICMTDQRISYGTHDIFVGRVKSVLVNGIRDPLLYADGGYARLVNETLETK